MHNSLLQNIKIKGIVFILVTLPSTDITVQQMNIWKPVTRAGVYNFCTLTTKKNATSHQNDLHISTLFKLFCEIDFFQSFDW